jgi:putative IMPACT (imprinted ancient) family translation regulator
MEEAESRVHYSIKENTPVNEVQTAGSLSEEIEIVIHRSRFIGSARRVMSKEEASLFLKNRINRHPQADHHVWAYRIDPQSGLEHYSDAGEPGGTAGAPVFGVLVRQKLENAMVVVTRYFGGTKLGISGLIEAYRSCTEETLLFFGITLYRPYRKYALDIDYRGWSSLRYFLTSTGIDDKKITLKYGEKISVSFFSLTDNDEKLKRELERFRVLKMIEGYDEGKPEFLAD